MAKKQVRMMTPVGTFIYPYLTKPDSYKGKEKYKADLRLSLPEARGLMAEIDGVLENHKKKDTFLNDGTPKEYNETYVPYTIDDSDETVVIRAALNRFGNLGKTDQFEQSPDVYDSQGNLLDPGIQIFSGTRGRMSLELYGWSIDNGMVGVSCRLKAAQITELADKDKREAGDYGFTAVDGGYDTTKMPPVSNLEGDDAVDLDGAEQY